MKNPALTMSDHPWFLQTPLLFVSLHQMNLTPNGCFGSGPRHMPPSPKQLSVTLLLLMRRSELQQQFLNVLPSLLPWGTFLMPSPAFENGWPWEKAGREGWGTAVCVLRGRGRPC